MDSFQVRAKDTSLLDTSHLVEELQISSAEMDIFPVLIGEHVAYFHEVDGGFDTVAGQHIVNLIHRVQGDDSPPDHTDEDAVEVHLDGWFYNMSVEESAVLTEYPDDDFVLSLKVDDYMMGRQSFSEALTEDVGKREQEYQPDGERE